MTFWPSTRKVFFWRLGLNTRLVRRKEKLTLCPYCLPLPVSSHRDAIVIHFHLIFSIFSIVLLFTRVVKGQACYNAAMDVMYIITVLGVILVSMTLHEAMHGYVAYWLGDPTAKLHGRLTLNPVKHIDPFLTILLPMSLAALNAISGVHAPIFGGAKPVPFNPLQVRFGEWGAALVALAGPLTNLIIAFIAFGILALSNPGAATDLVQLMISSNASVATNIMVQFILVNLGFFAFNILPIPPLDGSRVMYALAPDFIRRGMDAIERYGIMFVFIIVIAMSSLLGTVMTSIMTVILRGFSIFSGL